MLLWVIPPALDRLLSSKGEFDNSYLTKQSCVEEMDQTGFKKSFEALLCFIFFNWKGNQSLVGGLSSLLHQQSQAVSLSILTCLNLLLAAERLLYLKAPHQT